MIAGLIIGKFDPPHLGHGLLIETALATCETVTVIVCHKKGQHIPVEQRVSWLKQLYPSLILKTLDQAGFDDQSEAAWTAAVKPLVPAAETTRYFSSERSGKRYAQLLGIEHALVDKERIRHPVSSSLLKRHPELAGEFLDERIKDEVLSLLSNKLYSQGAVAGDGQFVLGEGKFAAQPSQVHIESIGEGLTVVFPD